MKEYGPDSKQSWLVVLAISVIKFMTYGPTEIAGMLMVYTMYRFGTTREAASLPYTLVYTIRNGSGPIIAYIGNIIGLRSTTLIGCISSSIAIGSCFFAESVMTVTILWGIVFGFGFAFGGLFLNSITMQHFERNFSKALGVTNAGAVLGICFFSPYLDFLVNKFGLSGAFLLLGGATLNSIPAAYFMLFNKPLKQSKIHGDRALSEDNNKMTKNPTHQKRKEGAHQNCFGNQQNGYTNNQFCESLETIFDNSKMPVKTLTFKAYGTDALEINWNKSDQCVNIPLNSKDGKQNYGSQIDTSHHCENDGQKYSRPIVSSNCERNYGCQIDSVCNKNHFLETQSRNSTQTDNEPEKLQTNKMMKILFSHPIFWLILICNGMHYFTFPAFFTLLIDYAIDIGIDPEYSKYIVIYSQCVEFFGCLVLGLLADLKLISSNGFAIILFLCQSVTLLLIPWFQNIIFLALLVLVFQWTQTGITLIYPSVVSDSLEQEIQPSALASMFLLAAPLDLTISPLIGYFRDEKGSYTGVYLTLSLAAFIGSLSQMCVLKCVNRRKHAAEI